MSIVAGGSGNGGGEGGRGGGEARQVYPTLTNTNYTSWCIRVQAIMEDREEWEVVEPEEGATTDADAARLARIKAKDKKIKANLLQCIPDDLLMQVAKKKTGKEAWDSLKARFIGADRVRDARLQTLRSEFDAIRMKEDDPLDPVVGKLTALSVRCSSLGGSISDAKLVKKLFDIVPERYLNIIAGIEQFYDLKTLPFDEAVGRLKAFEERTRRSSGSARSGESQALLTQAEWEARQKNAGGESSGRGKNGGGRGRGRGRGGSSGGRGGGGDTGKDGTGKRDKSHIKCFKCHGYGHYANRCPGGEKKKEEAHLVKTAEKEPTVLLAETVLLDQLQCSSEKQFQTVLLNEVEIAPELHLSDGGVPSGNVLYLDNGASNHMTGDVEKFKELDHAVLGRVRFGDDSTVEIQGKGIVVFQGKQGDHWILSDVYYIPKLRSNLISLGQLTETGHRITLDDEELVVCDKLSEKLIMRIPRAVNRLYKIELRVVEPKCLIVDIENQAWLWHGRLGHVNFRALKQLGNREMATGVPVIEHPEQVCSDCLAAKQARKPFPRTARWHATEKLSLVYVDLCGPIVPATAGGNKYFMLLVDDHSRWTHVYLLKSKDQAVEAFVKYKAEVENFSECRIKTLRSDRGGEFLAGLFAGVCEQAGIKRQLTAPYTPQQNGVVERKNRTVMEMARSLLKSMRVPGRFWGEAVRHAVYLLNRLPTKVLGDITPYETWTGRKPSLGHLRVFGCTAHTKFSAPHLRKLDDRSRPLVYLGTEDGSKAHRLYEPDSNRIIVSRDVIFEESKVWQWSSTSTAEESVDFVVEIDAELGSFSVGENGIVNDQSVESVPAAMHRWVETILWMIRMCHSHLVYQLTLWGIRLDLQDQIQ
jgi:hypothetical protein